MSQSLPYNEAVIQRLKSNLNKLLKPKEHW